jgi:hypothetical protein
MKLNPTWRIQTVTQLRENPRRGRVVAGVGAFIVLFAISSRSLVLLPSCNAGEVESYFLDPISD